MIKVSVFKTAAKRLVTKPQNGFMQKTVTIPMSNPKSVSLKFGGDILELSTKTTAAEVKALFPSGKIEGDYITKEMKRVKNKLLFSPPFIRNFKTWLHSINLRKKLSENDIEEIKNFMNLHKGQYIDTWKGHAEKDCIPNIHKLALFIRSINHTDKLDFYKKMSKSDWEICIDGIVNKPKEVVRALMEYKYDSRAINNAIDKNNLSPKIKSYIDEIYDFLSGKKLPHATTAYRGEGTLGIFSKVDLVKGKTLDVELERLAARIKAGEDVSKEIDEIAFKLGSKPITQDRFLSTAMEKSAADRYAKSAIWEIRIPKGTQGSMIESYNVERASEAELLLQFGSKLRVTDISYDKTKHRWETISEILPTIEKGSK